MGTDSDDGDSDIQTIMLLKILRLARLGRLVRAIRFKVFSELRDMVLGVLSGVRVLFWAIVLLFFIISVGGLILRKLVGHLEEEFRNVPSSMFTLFRCFTD